MNNQEQADAISKLSDLIVKLVPKAQTITKYGGTLFTLHPDEKEGQFCGVFQQKNHVQLVFSQGILLEDPDKLLEGSGKHRRHINLKHHDEIDKTKIRKFIQEAAENSNTNQSAKN